MALLDELVQEEDLDPEVMADQQHFQEPPGA